jgi:Hint module
LGKITSKYYDLCVEFRNEGPKEEYKQTGVTFPKSPPPPDPLPKPQPFCVETEQDLIKAITYCDSKLNEPSCLIDICSIRLPILGNISTLKNTNNTIKHGIDISNKNIIFSCEKTCPRKRCILDGASVSRIFYGSYTNITFLNFIFVNGYHPLDGGAIKVENISIATIINCSFVNNSAPFGSAIQGRNSIVTVKGNETSFVNNSGIGPPVEVLSSEMNISQSIFAGNVVSKYQAAILLFDSNLTSYDVHYLNSSLSSSMQESNGGRFAADCHVYVAVDSINFANHSSCMAFVDSSNQKPFPIIDVTDTCPAVPAPTLAPTLAQAPISNGSPSCFSSENTVEIQDIGQIPISLLRIGDMVKSKDGTFTQVYGFGHRDHRQVGIFLRIRFEDSIIDTNQSKVRKPEESSFLEISPKHLVMIHQNSHLYHIPAADVKVGDILGGRRVRTIHSVVRRGVYAPLTQSGDMRVNGLVTSNYVTLLELPSTILWDQHVVAHQLFLPQRIFCSMRIEFCQQEMYFHGYGPLAYLIIGSSSFLQTAIILFHQNTIHTRIIYLFSIGPLILFIASTLLWTANVVYVAMRKKQ